MILFTVLSNSHANGSGAMFGYQIRDLCAKVFTLQERECSGIGLQREGRQRNIDENRRVITIELEFSRDWSLQNPIPMLGLLVSEYQDFIKTTRASNDSSRIHGDDPTRSLDTTDPALKGTASVLDGHLDDDAEPEDDDPRPHDREVIVRE